MKYMEKNIDNKSKISTLEIYLDFKNRWQETQKQE